MSRAGETDPTLLPTREGAAGPSSPPSRANTGQSSGQSVRNAILPRREVIEQQRAPMETRRFRHVKPLGEGGMGEVLLALDEDIQRRVAIKRMRAGTYDADAVLRFADEVRIIGQLEHPGIVPVHDVGMDDQGQLYLVMKYVEGETLERVIARLRSREPEALARYPVRTRVEIAAKMLEALAYAHERGFLHRDLKPANVMIGTMGEVTLMDWGIAKQIGAEEPTPDALAATVERRERLVETETGSILGTPMYMSPEQAAGRNTELDARSDVFAAALVFHELFTLRHPLAGLASLHAVIASLLHQPLDELAALKLPFKEAEAPMELMWFLKPALAKDPATRYANASEMLAELRRVQAGELHAHCSITLSKRTAFRFAGWIDRHPDLFTYAFYGTLASVGVALALGVVALVRSL